MVQLRVAVLHGDDLLLLVLIVEHLSGVRELLVTHRDLRVVNVLGTRPDDAVIAGVVEGVGLTRKKSFPKLFGQLTQVELT